MGKTFRRVTEAVRAIAGLAFACAIGQVNAACSSPPAPARSLMVLRCVHAQVLQSLQLLHVPVDQSFQPTSNARNEAMFKEATDFSQHIRTIEKDLRAMERQLAGKEGQGTTPRLT